MQQGDGTQILKSDFSIAGDMNDMNLIREGTLPLVI